MANSEDNGRPTAEESRSGNGTPDIETGDTSLKEEDAVHDPLVVDWDGPDDPVNPLNWPTGKKVAIIAVVSTITFLSPFASTIISPATELVMDEFHTTSKTLGAFVTSVHLVGYTFGPLVIAPLSELYGRTYLYNSCNVIFFVFSIACAEAKTLASLIIFRLFVGIAASCPMTLGAGTIADLIPHEKRGLAMVTWIIGPLFGPTVAPIAGGYLAQAKGWRWTFWLQSILVGAATVAGFAILRETYPYVLLERKTKVLCKETNNPNLRSALASHKTPGALFAKSILRPLKMLFLSPIVFLLSLYAAIIYGYMYLCFTTFPRVFEGQYGFSRASSSLAYLGIGVGSIIALFICGATSDRFALALKARNGGVAKPEHRLPMMILAALIVPAGLFWYAWTAQHKNHYILPIIGTSFLGGGIVIAMMAYSTYLVDAYTTHAASATAAGTVFRSILGALLPLAGDSMYDALGVGWGTSVLGFISVAFIPVPLIFYLYGEKIRESRLFKVSF